MFRKTWIVAIAISCSAGMLSVIPAQADGLFPRVIPLGNIPSAQVTVLGNEPITTPGLRDATLVIDADASLAMPSLVVQQGSEVEDCSPGYEGLIAVAATSTMVGSEIRFSAFLSGTRTDPPHSGDEFEAGAAITVLFPATEILPTTQLVAVCVSSVPFVGSDPEPEPTPTATPTREPGPEPDPTSSPEPEPTPTPTAEPEPIRALDLAAGDEEVTPDESVLFFGRLVGSSLCIRHQAVTLMARRPDQGAFRTFRNGVTDVDGYFRFEAVVGNARQFVAVAPETKSCKLAQSNFVVLREQSAR